MSESVFKIMAAVLLVLGQRVTPPEPQPRGRKEKK